MSGDGPPILVIDGEIRIEVPEDKTTYATLIMLSMMNSVFVSSKLTRPVS